LGVVEKKFPAGRGKVPARNGELKAPTQKKKRPKKKILICLKKGIIKEEIFIGIS